MTKSTHRSISPAHILSNRLILASIWLLYGHLGRMENTTSGSRPKLYCGTACDQCFRCKARCSGDRPVCQRCQSNQSACTYSISKPLKRSKEGRNRASRSLSTGQPPNLTPSSRPDLVDTTRMPTVLNTRSNPPCSPAPQQLHTEQWNVSGQLETRPFTSLILY